MSLALLAAPTPARAHCDTLDGPVIADARAALEAGDPASVLKWVNKAGEAEIREAFEHALIVRKLGPEARELADRHFFETLVRVHRAGEGAPYTGLKPAGGEIDPGIRAADAGLTSGSVDETIHLLNEEIAHGIRARFAKVREAAKHKDHNVEAGRAFVAAYVDYIHYVEGLFEKAEGPSAHQGSSESAAHLHHE
ncbi:DUF6448 family protein [bacterium]|nr:DUF6448 family protein [bacterium]